ncbi:MAG: NRDE family protein [Flavobacteriales bacterium]|nr:NRDE family protein [Flavobacteriales bacterium]
MPVVLAYEHHPHLPLIVAADRDELQSRPTRKVEFLSDRPDFFAGKDLQGGGTWPGIDRTGRFAALTDYRDLRRPSVDGPSRGSLVLDTLDHGPIF